MIKLSWSGKSVRFGALRVEREKKWERKRYRESVREWESEWVSKLERERDKDRERVWNEGNAGVARKTNSNWYLLLISSDAIKQPLQNYWLPFPCFQFLF
jgi:hypothetical protein